jgi:hypothetical protein
LRHGRRVDTLALTVQWAEQERKAIERYIGTGKVELHRSVVGLREDHAAANAAT